MNLVSLVLIGAFAAYLLFVEYLDWHGRMDVLKEKHPLLWRAVNARPFRLILLLLIFGMLAENARERIQEVEVEPLVVKVNAVPSPDPGAKNAEIEALTRKISALEHKNQSTEQQHPLNSAQKGDKQNAGIERSIKEIDHLADHGTSAQKAWIDTNNDSVFVKSYTQWIAECTGSLDTFHEAAYAIQFKNAHGSAFMGCPTNHSVNGCWYWQEIEGKKQMLMSIITTLQQTHR